MACGSGLDQAGGYIDRVVVGARQIVDGACDRLIKAISKFRGFGDWNRAAFEIVGATIEHPLEHECHRDAARGHRRCDTRSGGYRQLEQRVESTEPPALRLIQKLTLQMHRRQVDYRLGQLKSRHVKRASNVRPTARKFSSAPSSRSTTEIT